MSNSRDDGDTDLCSSDDILREILIRLPIESIFTCNLVSKRWHRIISDPCFRDDYESHTRNSNTVSPHRQIHRLLGFFHSPSRQIVQPTYKFLAKSPPPPPWTTKKDEDIISILKSAQEFLNSVGNIICSSNGLFLCGALKYYIFNPTTKESYQLPPLPDINLYWGCFMGFVVAADANNFPSADISSIQYKVVHSVASFSDTNIGKVVEIQTFSSDTGEWRQSTVAVAGDFHSSLEFPRDTIVIRGVIYWLSSSMSDIGVYDPYKGDHMEMIRTPPASHMIQTPPASLQGRMGETTDGLLQLAGLNYSGTLRVWVCHSNYEDERQWSLLHELEVGFLLLRSVDPPFSCAILKLIAFHPHNPEDVFLSCDGCIVLCHLNTTPRLERVHFHGLVFRDRLHPYSLPFWPTPKY